ncbi:helix-turn-helix domain-containing protein [Streptomyces sp. NPDC057621]|uniref:helix-turn-helix domain-containing protein n=1 Tax=Streptomyces sp. NPDC057621 TaxID=3346186 RepID=UPI0036CA8351
MTHFDAVDALLAAAGPEAELPPAQQRRILREALHLSRAQVARALDVSPSTVAGWESGRDPGGEVRDRYAYFLKGAQDKLASLAADAASKPEPEPGADAGAPPAAAPHEGEGQAPAGPEADEVEALAVPRPCVLCGHDARHQVAGYPQHLDPAECTAPTPAPAPTLAPVPGAPVPPARAAVPGRTTRAAARSAAPVKTVRRGGRVQTAADVPDLIADAVTTALAEHQGDVEAATAALVKQAIPNAMTLLDHTRKGGRYDVVAHPWLPDILHKQSAKGADQIWEARPKWTRPHLPAGEHAVTALDINGAYLSALKTHLPLGQLEHSEGNVHDRRRAGVHLITPPAWNHHTILPNPLGDRDEDGPLWVTEPTLRLLLRLSGPNYGLCQAPVIHESFTSGATESLLEKFRITLKDARDQAIAADDTATGEYVKAMYSKFVSTMGESTYNRDLNRPDWMHLIRSQAFANLWTKAYKAHSEDLSVVSVQGTDELHVIGDWRRVFTEGRDVTEVKVKDTYTAGTG